MAELSPSNSRTSTWRSALRNNPRVVVLKAKDVYQYSDHSMVLSTTLVCKIRPQKMKKKASKGVVVLSTGTQELDCTTLGKNFSRIRKLSQVLRLDVRRLFCRTSRLSLDPTLQGSRSASLKQASATALWGHHTGLDLCQTCL